MITIIQIIVSIAIVALILLQQRGSSMSGLLGGGEGSVYQTRRGMEKIIFAATIVLSFIFVMLSIYQLLS